MKNIIYRKKNHIAYITISREQVLNCFNYETLIQLQQVTEEIHLDSDIQVVIITGAGTKAFSAGADLKERKTLTDTEVRRNVKAIQESFNKIAKLPQPTIAAVNGYAFGGGFELMLACDFAIAVTEAKMGLTETSWAIIPGAGGTQRLPRLVGEMRAKELIFTAKKLTAVEAMELGILLKVVEQDELMETCEELAFKIIKNGPIAIKQAKFAISQGMNTDLHTGLEIEAIAYEQTIPTEDRMEALLAFSEKRAPNFKGR
ncbi:Enoyl-CoA hydratase/carnithine racemase [Oceanobacillus limi]|uniref:Enoyl-CoA hydratase/carnithine racemase n=1 Tax=Oceanobacillus limi TaxID=930131 RepID=A0A1I0EWU2_9BACI|nr:enoyl-CoA hydratase-related protein [Oceanobacillus limi]SET50126.1 Enoyl-CoA hydratase/carnithine racemase [Oceanobacillus limi]